MATKIIAEIGLKKEISTTREEIERRLRSEVVDKNGRFNFLAWWCQEWFKKMKGMSVEERRKFVEKKGRETSWDYLSQIIDDDVIK